MKIVLCFLVVASSLTVVACGQTGDLYLPSNSQHSHATPSKAMDAKRK